jgi:hypothetical protein
MLEEPLAGSGGAHGGTPGLRGQFAYGVAGEGQQVASTVERFCRPCPKLFHVVAFGPEGVERLVFDLPACPARGGQSRQRCLGESEQSDKCFPCLIAAQVPRCRREHVETITA